MSEPPPGNDHFYRLLVERLSDYAVFMLHPDGSVTSWNEGARLTFGYAPEEIIGKSAAVLFTPEDRRAGVPALEMTTAAREGRASDERWHVRGDGSRFFASGVLTALRDEGGDLLGYAKVLRDLTERKLADQRLATEQAIARVMAESVTPGEATARTLEAVCRTAGWEWGAFWVVDEAERVLRCADVWRPPDSPLPDFEQMSRATLLEQGVGLPGRVWSAGRPAWITDVADDANFPRRAAAARAGLHGAFCFPVVTGGRVLGVMEFFSREVRPPDPQILTMMLVVGSQIGQFMDRRRSEGLLLGSEARNTTVLQTALDCIISMNSAGEVIEWNPAAERTFGYTRAEAMGRELAELVIPPPLRDAHRRGLSKYLASGEGPVIGRRIQITGLRKDGTEFPVELAITRVPVQGPPSFIGYLRDISDRHEADAALRASEERFRRLMEQSPLSTQIFAPDGRVVSANAAWERLFGVTVRDIAEYNILHDPQLVRHGIMPLIERAFRGEAVTMPPIPYMPDRGTFAGQERWCAAVAYAVKATGGQVEDVILVHEDITERMRAEAALRESEERLRLGLDAGNTGTWDWDIVNEKVTWSERVYEFHGLKPGQFSGRVEDFAKLVHPEDVARVNDAIRKSVADGTPYEIEFRVVHPSGEVRWIATSGKVYYAADGKPLRMLGATSDVTARRRAEAAVAESEARFRQLAETIPQLAWMAKPDGWIFWYNRRWYEYTGTTPEQMEGWGWQSVHDPAQLPSVMELWQRSIATGDPFEMEFPLKGAGGGFRWFLTRVAPLRDKDGRIALWFGTNTDIEDRRRVAEERARLLEAERTARVEAERASQIKDEFLATLSHELRTPLNAILGWSQILRTTGRDDEDYAQGLATIERNARAQTRIIEDLLDMSRIVSGKVRLDVQRIDLVAVIEAAIDTLRPMAAAKEIRLQPALDPVAGPVSGDPNRLQQVFWNLLTNAVKFTPRGGRVQILLERVNSHLEASVIDTGEGIKPEFLPYVFDRFRQADGSTTRRHGGLGLGLSITKQLVELHGGTVRARSAGEGKGSAFVVSLPLTVAHSEDDGVAVRRHPGASATAPPLGGAVSLEGVRVLVVDDEPDARALVRRLLQNCKAEVTAVGSAAEAVDAVQSLRPDVLVSDIGMPGEDGYALIRRVRKLGAAQGGNVPALALTAYARSEDRQRAVLSGYQMHVSKPVEPSELITMIASLAGKMGGNSH